MRAYVGVTAQELSEFLKSATLDVSDVYAATEFFIKSNSDLDEEEVEYTLSLVAAEDAQDLVAAETGAPLVLAFEVSEDIIEAKHEMSISLSAPLSWKNLECCFEISDDGEELTWFATQEISEKITEWLA
jgi:hypothetical protein